MNHPDTDIADAIIAGIGGADNSTEQMAAVVTNLERAGFKIIPRLQHEALMATVDALKPFQSGSAWGTILSWLVAGAEAAGVRQSGVKEAARFVRLQCRVEEAIAALRAASIQIEGEGKP